VMTAAPVTQAGHHPKNVGGKNRHAPNAGFNQDRPPESLCPDARTRTTAKSADAARRTAPSVTTHRPRGRAQ